MQSQEYILPILIADAYVALYNKELVKDCSDNDFLPDGRYPLPGLFMTRRVALSHENVNIYISKMSLKHLKWPLHIQEAMG